jgi:hypothetical protein
MAQRFQQELFDRLETDSSRKRGGLGADDRSERRRFSDHRPDSRFGPAPDAAAGGGGYYGPSGGNDKSQLPSDYGSLGALGHDGGGLGPGGPGGPPSGVSIPPPPQLGGPLGGGGAEGSLDVSDAVARAKQIAASVGVYIVLLPI